MRGVNTSTLHLVLTGNRSDHCGKPFWFESVPNLSQRPSDGLDDHVLAEDNDEGEDLEEDGG